MDETDIYLGEKVAIYDVLGPYDAVVASGNWNGWALPFFTLDTVKEIAKDTVSLRLLYEDADVVEVEGDRVYLVNPYEKEEIIPNENGLYPVGAWSWVWEVVQ